MRLLLLIGIALILWDPWLKRWTSFGWNWLKDTYAEYREAKRLAAIAAKPKDSDVEIQALCRAAKDNAGYWSNRDSRFTALKILARKYPQERQAKEQMAWTIRNDSVLNDQAMIMLDKMTQENR